MSELCPETKANILCTLFLILVMHHHWKSTVRERIRVRMRVLYTLLWIYKPPLRIGMRMFAIRGFVKIKFPICTERHWWRNYIMIQINWRRHIMSSWHIYHPMKLHQRWRVRNSAITERVSSIVEAEWCLKRSRNVGLLTFFSCALDKTGCRSAQMKHHKLHC